MVSRFTKLFKKTDPDEQRAFQARVAKILGELYPERTFTCPSDPLVIEADGSQFGLSNLLSNFLLEPCTDDELRCIVADHFAKVFAGTKMADREGLSWEEAKPRLMPQLMPEEFLSKLPLVSSDFGDGVQLGFVLDTEEAYSYVGAADLERWNVSESDIREIAIENLKSRTQSIEMMAFPGENALAVVNTMDGFDAVRIILPKLHEFFAETVGMPFLFGIPNRDFLICWSKNGDEDFQSKMRSQISSDFDQRPYPLSRRPFEVLANGEIHPVQSTSFDDPVTVAAVNN